MMLSTHPIYTTAATYRNPWRNHDFTVNKSPKIPDSASARCKPKDSAPANTARSAWRGKSVEGKKVPFNHRSAST
jgi:hypothetical protein